MQFPYRTSFLVDLSPYILKLFGEFIKVSEHGSGLGPPLVVWLVQGLVHIGLEPLNGVALHIHARGKYFFFRGLKDSLIDVKVEPQLGKEQFDLRTRSVKLLRCRYLKSCGKGLIFYLALHPGNSILHIEVCVRYLLRGGHKNWSWSRSWGSRWNSLWSFRWNSRWNSRWN